MKRVLFVIGAPGVGKTTALSTLLDPFGTTMLQKPKWTLSPPVALVGHYGRDPHAHYGGDTLAYNGAHPALDYWEKYLLTDDKFSSFILDGDRFSTKNVFERVNALPNLDVRAVYLTASEKALSERRNARGSTQNEVWMKGRGTKSKRFAQLFGDTCVTIETTDMSKSEVAIALHDALSKAP